MQPVSDAFLLQVAEISAGLVGLFLVGVFFFIQTGFRQVTDTGEILQAYFRSGTRIVLVLFAIPILLSISLVALDLAWSRVLFLVLSLVLIAANVDSVARVRPIARSRGMLELSVNEALGTIGVLLLVTLPWILGGFHPTREDLTWAILIAFLIGFLSISALVLSAFDLARLDAGDIVEDVDQPPPAETGPITKSFDVMDQNSDEPEDPGSDVRDRGSVA
jgi:hypothetical protein